MGESGELESVALRVGDLVGVLERMAGSLERIEGKAPSGYRAQVRKLVELLERARIARTVPGEAPRVTAEHLESEALKLARRLAGEAPR